MGKKLLSAAPVVIKVTGFSVDDVEDSFISSARRPGSARSKTVDFGRD